MKLPTKFRKFLRVFASFLILISATPSTGFAAALLSPGNKPSQINQISSSPMEIENRADSYGVPLSTDKIAAQYAKPSILLQQDDTVQFKVKLDQDGLYTISIDMAANQDFINGPEGQLKIDGEFPFPDTQNIVFPIYFQNSKDTFPLDRYGNQGLIRQVSLPRWSKVALRDTNFSQKYPLQFNLTKGEHTFEFTLTKQTMYLGSIYIAPFTPPPDYSQYLKDHSAPDTTGVSVPIEAEWPAFKNDTSIRPISDMSLDVTPYDTYKLLLNTLGGEQWQRSGTAVYYRFSVPQDGMYFITFHALQNTKNNFTVFRRVTLDDEVLFDELNEVGFNYSTKWTEFTLGGATPYLFYMTKGEHLLGIEANDSPYRPAIEKIQKVLTDINTVSLQINKLTGNQVDQYKEWVISDYIPNIKDQLISIANDLSADKKVLTDINHAGGSQQIQIYQEAIDNILYMAQDPDKIPIHMDRFSEGSGAAAQLLANLLPDLQGQPLALDKIYIHSPDQMPSQAGVPFYTSFVETFKRFLNSFAPDPYQSTTAQADELSVWVNRPRQYVDLLQTMTDQTFTKDTGIKVKFSIMPDESKLILANAAGIQPDVALGVSTDKPYDLAVRKALYDLRSFPDFDSYINNFSPGAFLSYIIDDSVYAIPETQDFWVTFYRKDILKSLNIPVPKTWNEVIEILPELQRNRMNFSPPISGTAGSKGYLVTAPYIFNQGAQLYSADGFSSGLGSDAAINAMKFMAESFTKYGMPLTTANFYNDFRIGKLPIGVSNVTTYIQLTTAAPELKGLWGIDLYPATVLKDGTQNRYATGSAQACIMFASTNKAKEGWEFLKWWMSTSTQVDFEQQLILNYGSDYLWYSANLEAFKALPIPEADREVILAQWQWLQEPAKIPGSYMEEREISNAWNSIVFNGVNPRIAIDSSIITINREITRKLEEFGYIKNGVKVKDYKVPTLDLVKGWMANGK
jgi:ABC-type glycerol-3-phosphate transport system substrate-binding protein